MDRGPSPLDYRDRQSGAGMSSGQQSEPASFIQHFFGLTESQKTYKTQKKPLLRQQSRQRADTLRKVRQQKLAIRKFFESGKDPLKMDQLRHSLGIQASHANRAPEEYKEEILKKIDEQKRKTMSSLEKTHRKQLDDLRGNIKKSISNRYSQSV